ncbi:hypothetical protein [Nitrosophilus labii]|uniref:hypothetical protein n=1 Tax=Nitrosophilus labii TaxID=2706014 RepID=UPI001656CFCD|nr:hypothetical protein [Nitrosophilus labii]
MKIFSLCIYNKNHKFDFDNFLNNLCDNEKYILEILYCGRSDKKEIISLNLENINETAFRNSCIEKAKGEYLVWISSSTELEESTLDEYYETIMETNADIIYPNEIQVLDTEEKIKNFSDWFEKEKELLQALDLEEYLPKWGIAIKKEKLNRFNGFEKKYGSEAFYAFVYKNLKNLSLKLSQESFIINKHIKNENQDFTYKSLILRDIIKQNDIKELFLKLNWKNENIALATAYTLIGEKLYYYGDFFNASNFFRQALISFHNQETLKRLIESYYQMGLFEEAKKMLKTQESNEDILNEFNYKIEKAEKLILELEKLVQTKNISDIVKIKKDIFEFYQGAPIQNIFGVVMYNNGKIEDSYKYFYKAVTMNPLDHDIISNIVGVAKKLKKEEEVISLIERLTK